MQLSHGIRLSFAPVAITSSLHRFVDLRGSSDVLRSFSLVCASGPRPPKSVPGSAEVDRKEWIGPHRIHIERSFICVVRLSCNHSGYVSPRSSTLVTAKDDAGLVI